MKKFMSDSYNYIFNAETGYFVRWGKTLQDDPKYSPFGPEIADIEITTTCHGPAGKVCDFCYKANTPNGKNMSFEMFKSIFDNLPKTLTQIAFGADATLEANPDVWKIMAYCRENDVVPNVTVANITDATALNLKKYCGAVAVSRYANSDYCYDSIKRLTDIGMNQINIHQLLSEETYDQVLQTIEDIQTDSRLEKLNAIVFLSLKQTGRGERYNRLSDDKFENIIKLSLEKKIDFGFDSCSANKFLAAVKSHPNYKQFVTMSEPCESTCFSMYINVDGDYFPCSFSEHRKFDSCDWTQGIHVPDYPDFAELWSHNKTLNFRDVLLDNLDNNGVHACPLYKI